MARKTKTYQVQGLKITIDQSKCISCGLCAEIAPKTFELDKEMMSVIKDKGPYDSPETIKEAASNCATQAIVVE